MRLRAGSPPALVLLLLLGGVAAPTRVAAQEAPAAAEDASASRSPRALLGLPLMDRATLVEGERLRVRLPEDYDRTVKWYRKHFTRHNVAVRWKKIVDLPGIKATHVECRAKECQWSGMNIYSRHGETRLYLFPRQPAPAQEAAPPAGSRGS